MNRTILVVFLIMFATFSSGLETISNLQTNSPINLGQQLVISGNYNNTDANQSVFCKFLINDSNGVSVSRLTDALTFPNGDFYAESIGGIQEPIFKRDQTFTVNVACNAINQDVNFLVEQREAIDRQARQEFLFLFERGNLDTVVQLGSIILVIIALVLLTFIWIKKARNF